MLFGRMFKPSLSFKSFETKIFLANTSSLQNLIQLFFKSEIKKLILKATESDFS